jgi:Domain of unknown function (DUF4124)
MKYSLLACLLLLLSFNAHGALHKWVDADGKVHYSDSPPPPDARTQKLELLSAPATETGTSASDVPATSTTAEREAEWRKTQKAKEEAAQKAAKEQEAALARQMNCQQARSQLLTLQNSPAIATYDANGERRLMNDADRQRGIEATNKAISQYCD